MTSSAIPLGERDGSMLRAYEVENGLRCGCVCPGCRRPLVAANQGEKRLPYFRHAELEGCSRGRSEGIRRAAVQVIAQHKRLLLPPFSERVVQSLKSGKILTKEVTFVALSIIPDQVEKFVDLGDLRAHARLTLQGRSLIVRIKCSARQEHERKRRLQDMAVSSIEVDLNWLTDEQINEKAVFTHAVLDDPRNRTWIRSLKGEALVNRVHAELEREAERLDADWQQAEAERIASLPLVAAQPNTQQQEYLDALALHRNAQAELARSTTRDGAGIEHTWKEREALIVATMFQAVREWSGVGAECSSCRLVSPPGSRFCQYCTSDSQQLRELRFSPDLELTIEQIKRCWVKPHESLQSAPHLVVLPEVS